MGKGGVNSSWELYCLPLVASVPGGHKVEWGRFPDGDLPPEGDFPPAACILGCRGGRDGGESDCGRCRAGLLVDVPCLFMAVRGTPSILSLIEGGGRRGNRGGSSGERLLA